MKGFLIGAALLAASAAKAQNLRDCETFEASARNVDFSQSPQDYANGAIRLIALDVGEPAAAAWHLMVLHPDAEGLYQDCTLISRDQSLGYGYIALSEAAASYDPARGLTVEVPARIWLPEQNFQNGTTLLVTINQASGTVTLDQILGGE